MADTVHCVRCGQDKPGVTKTPRVEAKTAAEIVEKICGSCWQEWENSEVMVINELRLNFMDPASLEVLHRHMREFLLLDGPPPTDRPAPTVLP